MRRLLVLAACALLAACSSQEATLAPRNPPTLVAPPQFVEADQQITLANVSAVKYLGRLDQPGTPTTVFSHALSPDATRLVALNNEQVLAWNLLNGDLLFQTARGNVTQIFYASDKTEVYGLDASGAVTVFDANTGALKTTFRGQPNYNGTVAYSPDAGWLALGGTDGTVKVWDTYARQSLATIDAHSSPIGALAFSADGETLATAGEEGVLRLWRWRDRAMTAEHKPDQPVVIRRLAYTPDGSYLGIGTDQDARLWSQSNGQLYVLDTGRGGAIQVLQFSPDSHSLLAGNQGAGLSLWNLTGGTLAARLPDTQGSTIAAAFSPDSALLLTAVMNGKVALWNLSQIGSSTVNQAALDVGTRQILDLDWTSDSRLLLFFDAGGPVYLWGAGS